MKKIVIDKLLILAFCWLLAVVYCVIFPNPTSTILSICLCISSIVFSFRVLLMPIDYLFGKVTETAYFSATTGRKWIESFPKSYCVEWKFYSGKNRTLILLNPEVHSFENIFDCPTPPKDKKVKITYLRLSRFLLCWSEENEDRDSSLC